MAGTWRNAVITWAGTMGTMETMETTRPVSGVMSHYWYRSWTPASPPPSTFNIGEVHHCQDNRYRFLHLNLDNFSTLKLKYMALKVIQTVVDFKAHWTLKIYMKWRYYELHFLIIHQSLAWVSKKHQYFSTQSRHVVLCKRWPVASPVELQTKIH